MPKKSSTQPSELVFQKKRDAMLTDREREVLGCYARGLTHAETGDELGIGQKTVASYLQRVREKARAKSRADLIKLALKEKLLKPNAKKLSV